MSSLAFNMSIFFNLRLSYSLSYASRIFQRSSVYILLKIIIRVFWKNCFLSWPQWYGDEWFDEIEKTIDRSMQLRRACTSEPETTLVLFFMSIPSPSSKGRYTWKHFYFCHQNNLHNLGSTNITVFSYNPCASRTQTFKFSETSKWV